MPRGGKREGAGRPTVKPEQPEGSPTKNLASEILASLSFPDPVWKVKHPDHKKDKPCHCEICLWRRLCLSDPLGGARWALEYLWNRRDGKPVHTVNHLHDKPLDVNLKVSYADVIQKARKRVVG